MFNIRLLTLLRSYHDDWAAFALVLIDQSQLRQRLRELDVSREQSLTRRLFELLGLFQVPAHELRVIGHTDKTARRSCPISCLRNVGSSYSVEPGMEAL
jgi:hypothetical protein